MSCISRTFLGTVSLIVLLFCPIQGFGQPKAQLKHYFDIVQNPYGIEAHADWHERVFSIPSGCEVVKFDVSEGARNNVRDGPHWDYVTHKGTKVGVRVRIKLESGPQLNRYRGWYRGSVVVHYKQSNFKGPTAPILIGDVRADAGPFYEVDSGSSRKIGEFTWNTCPEGYHLAGTLFSSNGFWVCLRNDLKGKRLFVGDVHDGQGYFYEVNPNRKVNKVRYVGKQAWKTCPNGFEFVGIDFHGNGFWVCIEK